MLARKHRGRGEVAVTGNGEALETVIHHATQVEDDYDDIAPTVTALAASGDTSLMPRLAEALTRFLDEANFYGGDLVAGILASVQGTAALPALLHAPARDLGDDQDARYRQRSSISCEWIRSPHGPQSFSSPPWSGSGEATMTSRHQQEFRERVLAAPVAAPPPWRRPASAYRYLPISWAGRALARDDDERRRDRRPSWVPPIMTDLVTAAMNSRLRTLYPFTRHNMLRFARSADLKVWDRTKIAPVSVAVVPDPDRYLVYAREFAEQLPDPLLETDDPAAAVAEVERLLSGWT
jgi:hypothetical protein